VKKKAGGGQLSEMKAATQLEEVKKQYLRQKATG